MTARSYSIWLMPPTAVRRQFTRVIDDLSRRLGTPRFDPHVTLAGTPDLEEAEAISRTAALAAHLAPVPVQLTDVGYTDEYFRCLFINAKRTAGLLGAHRMASEQLGQAPTPDYAPHLSLVYGALDPKEKEKIIDEIGRRFDMNFIAAEIAVCMPAGPPEGWRVIGPFPLTGHEP